MASSLEGVVNTLPASENVDGMGKMSRTPLYLKQQDWTKEVRAKPCPSTVSRLQGLAQLEKPNREHLATPSPPQASVWCPRLSFCSLSGWNSSSTLPKHSHANDIMGQHPRSYEEPQQMTLGISYWNWLSGCWHWAITLFVWKGFFLVNNHPNYIVWKRIFKSYCFAKKKNP